MLRKITGVIFLLGLEQSESDAVQTSDGNDERNAIAAYEHLPPEEVTRKLEEYCELSSLRLKMFFPDSFKGIFLL